MSVNAIKPKAKKLAAVIPVHIPDSYLRLIRMLPLMPIKSAGVHKQALKLTNELFKKRAKTGKLSRGENGYLSILVHLIEIYEKERFPRTRVRDGEILEYLIEAGNVTQSQVERDTGIAAPTISAVIAGRRRLTRDQIGRLSEYFGVTPTIFTF